MGRRGPAPTPTKVKLPRGETRPSRLNVPVATAEAGKNIAQTGAHKMREPLGDVLVPMARYQVAGRGTDVSA